MEIINREVAYEGEYLRLLRKTAITHDKHQIIWETVERTNVYGRGAVIIAAMDQKDNFILERHWRAPIESFIIQFPGGLTDRQYENNEQTAKRELLEETGYNAKTLIPVISTVAFPVLSSTMDINFFAPDVEYIGDVKRDIAEEFQVLQIPHNNIHEYLLDLPDNTMLDLKVPGLLWVLQAKGLI